MLPSNCDAWSKVTSRLLDGLDVGSAELALLDFVPGVSPTLDRPEHLAPIAQVVEATAEGERRVVVSAPPQHGKTQLLLHGLAWLIAQNTHQRHAYVTYEATRAEVYSRQVQDLVRATGLGVEGSRRSWRVSGSRGGLFATGIGGPLTGEPVDGVLIVDDPYKNRAEAESGAYRARAEEWFRDVALSRIHPGASVVVNLARWHPADLGGKLIGEGWEHMNLPAIGDDGRALWEAKRPLSWLLQQQQRAGDYTWSSLWQGRPRPRGGSLFGDPVLCDWLEVAAQLQTGARYAIGVDCAYTKRTYADRSVGLVLAAIGDRRVIVDVVSRQVKATEFRRELSELRRRFPWAPMRWYGSGAEQGVADLMNEQDRGLRLEVLPALADKFVRAQPVAAAWNAGRVLVPADAPWVNDTLPVLLEFTGVNDPRDDEVDALAAAFDALETAAPAEGAASERRTWGKGSIDV